MQQKRSFILHGNKIELENLRMQQQRSFILHRNKIELENRRIYTNATKNEVSFSVEMKSSWKIDESTNATKLKFHSPLK
jgi:hypothetical protein